MAEDVAITGPASTPDEVLAFWFSPVMRAHWFEGSADADAAVRAVLGTAAAAAAFGRFDDWAGDPDGALALVILLDQVPRNIHRGTALAYATDAKARAVADRAVSSGFDLAFADDDQRLFFYLPFEHSEDIADQRRSVALFMERTSDAEYQDFAKRHLAVIERFGRFPHRNAIVGREPTDAEIAWLRGGGERF